MQDFRGPKPNSAVITASKVILPLWLKLREQLSIVVQGEKQDIEAFSRSRHAVILLNHPDRQDPFVIVELARRMKEEFYCIAARECFDWDNGWRGWLFQRIGCYSVARGKADFHSIATTEKILREGKRKLVVFPEAEITADEEHVHDLHKAIFHILLDVQKEFFLAKSKERHQVVIIPAASKFSLAGDLASAVKPALNRLEQKLAIGGLEDGDILEHIKTIVDAYLDRVFKAYGIAKPQDSLENITENGAVQILAKMASALKLQIDRSQTPTEMLYTLRNKTAGGAPSDSIALEPDAFHCAGIAKPSIQSDFERVERLLIMQRMLQHTNSEVQCCRILDFIESELFGRITPKGWQSCHVQLGAPIDVSSFVEQYLESKDSAVVALSDFFKQRLQSMLATL
ncbi:MAG: 1-acyl-sn-glycerol-3-phosphate acyltransferase [Cyanobacteria bacterium SZAS LIN-3]|nr:1-acyl-sn-glycerol-3-phosphate acyltransferase [Cyanobacteria bacterium SZAS LIN-3]MBS2005476.1 1-acyl-sn-glycerol-3-phosphate acyltransferase [Cyanobacteria bacterium SZAS TMP-1]